MPVLTFQPTTRRKWDWAAPSLGRLSTFNTTGGDFTLPVKDDSLGNPIAVVGDLLRLKAVVGSAVLDNWLQVTARDTSPSGYTNFTVERRSGTPGTFPAGTAVVNFQQANQGWIVQSSDTVDGPFLAVRTHQGDPWNNQYEQMRLGNLYGTFDYGASSVYGFTAGQYGQVGQTWLSLDATNGLRIGSNTTSKITLDSSGNATFTGTLTSSAGSIGGWTLSSSAIYKDTGVAATSAGMAPADWPFYAGQDNAHRSTAPFRVSPAGALTATNATITGAITATSGTFTGTANSLTAGGGNVVLDSSGISIAEPAAYAGTAAVNFVSGAVTESGLYALTGTGSHKIEVINNAIAAKDSTVEVYSRAPAAHQAVLSLASDNASHQAITDWVVDASGNAYVEMYGASFAGLLIGTAGTPPSAMLHVVGSGIFTGGLNVGAQTGAGTGQVKIGGASLATISVYGTTSAVDTVLELGQGGTGNHNSYVDLVGDDTYTDYGLRIIRYATGPNAGSQISNRGTGQLTISNLEAAAIVFQTASTSRFFLNSSGHLNWSADNTYDLGAAGASRPRHLYLAGNIQQSTPLGARVYRSTAQTLTTATLSVVSFDNSMWMTDSNWAIGTPTALYAKTAGKYLIVGHVEYASNANGRRNLNIRINGTNTIASCIVGAIATTTTTMTISAIQDMAVNDYAELIVYQDSGGNLNINAATATNPYTASFELIRIA